MKKTRYFQQTVNIISVFLTLKFDEQVKNVYIYTKMQNTIFQVMQNNYKKLQIDNV